MPPHLSVPANHTIDSLALRPQPARIALAAAQNAAYRESLDLGRLVLEDEVPSNGDSGQSFSARIMRCRSSMLVWA